MKSDRKNDLQGRLEGLDPNERRKLYKRAARMRRAACEKKEGRGEAKWHPGADDDVVLERNVRRRQDSIHEWALRLLAQERAAGSELDRPPAELYGTVTTIGPGFCRVDADGEDLGCELAPDIAREQKTAIAVGDEVGLHSPGDGRWIAVEVKPRRTWLSRPDPFLQHVERVLVANVDPVCVVAALRQPDLQPEMVDRFVVAIRRGQAEPLILANKADLLAPDERDEGLALLDAWARAGIRVLPCSAETGEGIDALRQLLEGRTTAFVGLSGAGKSSLLNALRPGLGIAVNAVRDYDARGRHTTTASMLHDLGGGTRAIDTPGVRRFGLWGLEPDELGGHFPELLEASAACRFRDCTHTHEPHCAVKQGVADGLLPEARYESYLKILRTMRGKPTYDR